RAPSRQRRPGARPTRARGGGVRPPPPAQGGGGTWRGTVPGGRGGAPRRWTRRPGGDLERGGGMDARFHLGLAWIAAAALVGAAACAGGGAGPSKGGGGTPGGGTGPGGPNGGPAPACIRPARFGTPDEAAPAGVTDLVCADARSGNLAANRLMGDAGASCAGQFKTSSDADIAGILAVYDEGQMRQSNFAEANAMTRAVQDFAHEMSAAHA